MRARQGVLPQFLCPCRREPSPFPCRPFARLGHLGQYGVQPRQLRHRLAIRSRRDVRDRLQLLTHPAQLHAADRQTFRAKRLFITRHHFEQFVAAYPQILPRLLSFCGHQAGAEHGLQTAPEPVDLRQCAFDPLPQGPG